MSTLNCQRLRTVCLCHKGRAVDTGSPGALIRDIRRRKGLSQAKLARRLGTTQSAVSRIERGDESPTVARLAGLLQAMGEQLSLGATPIDPWADRDDLAAEQRLTPAERLAQGVSLASLATELAGLARPEGRT